MLLVNKNSDSRIRFVLLLLMLFISASAHSNDACSMVVPFKLTITDYSELQHNLSPNAFIKKDIGDNKCFPQSKSLLVYADTLCNFNGVIPVVGISAWSLNENEKIQYAMFMMRGTEADKEKAVAYFNSKFTNITENYLTELKGPRFFGFTYAWKNYNQYIVLGQHEPGYDPQEMSLHLHIGTKEGIEFGGTDLNSCK